MASRRTRTARARRRRPAPRRGWELRLPHLDQRQLDMVGLGMVVLGVFLAFVFYLSWDGGKVGEGAADALRWLFGAVAYLAPVGLFATGSAVVLRPMLPTLTPFKAGGLCLAGGLMLGLSAQAFGLGPEHPMRHHLFYAPFMTRHGGAVGEVLWWASSTLFQQVGAVLLFLFLMIAGVLLLTGASVASVVRITGGAVAATGGRVKQSTHEFAALLHARLRQDEVATATSGCDAVVPAGFDPVPELGATHGTVGGEPPQLDGAQRYPDLFATGGETVSDAGVIPCHTEADQAEPEPGVVEVKPEEEEEEAPERAGGEEQRQLTPQGYARDWLTVGTGRRYRLPDAGLLRRAEATAGPDVAAQQQIAKRLIEALGHFGVEAGVVGMVTGPSVTRYELQLAPGTKVGKVAQLKDDLAYALASTEIRILAPIPGKRAVGVEVPNPSRRIVRLGDIYRQPPKEASPLAVWLGKDIAGNAVWTDLAKMPHILVAGTTGSGKSGCVNAMLCSILMRSTPDDVRLVLVDPKQVELNHYDSIPHLLTPVVSAPRMAANVLGNLTKEMQSRYDVMGKARCRNLPELNRARLREGEQPLPHILCVIDELADLMMIAPAEVEDTVIRLAQRSRAVGLHLLLATQRPSTDIITGTIKVNVPARIAFAVSSQVDSRVILDQGGAEALLGQGDMLFRPVGSSKLQRIQGAYVTEEEIAALTGSWRDQGEPELREELLGAVARSTDEAEQEFSPDEDELLEDAIALVVQTRTASVSMLQRRLRVGYTRAGRLIDMLERRGIISGYEGSKPRQVLVREGDLERVLTERGGRVAGRPPDTEPLTVVSSE